MTKLSLMTALMLTAVVAEASETTVSGKAQAYLYTTDGNSNSLFSNENTQIGTAVTLDVTHALTKDIKANFLAIGFTNLNTSNNMEGSVTGGYFNVANLTATWGDTTVVAGRQLVSTPMLGGFDWLLAPGAFEAYTVTNTSIDNLTLVGAYVKKWRANNTGETFVDLTDTNYALGAAYGVEDMAVSLWYYGIDHIGYSQVYADASKKISDFTVAAQFASTEYDAIGSKDATAYGLKVSTTLSGFDVSVAYNRIQDNDTGFVGVDSLYTSSWNTFASTVYTDKDVDAFKIDASKTFGDIDTALSYASYGEDGEEINLILGYGVTKSISLDAIYSNTTENVNNAEDTNAVEFIATYTF